MPNFNFENNISKPQQETKKPYDPESVAQLEQFYDADFAGVTPEERESSHLKNQKIEEKLSRIANDEKLLSRYLNIFSSYKNGVEYVNENILKLVSDKNFLDLPDGYAQKGGSARIILEKTLGINGSDVPRDIDLCYVGDRDLVDLLVLF